MTLARTESKSFGPIDLPIDALWGAQTAPPASFAIGEQRRLLPVIQALA